MSIYPAHALKPGDRINFDFRGANNHLGEVTIFDIRQINRNYLTLVLLDETGNAYHRQVHAGTEFEVA